MFMLYSRQLSMTPSQDFSRFATRTCKINPGGFFKAATKMVHQAQLSNCEKIYVTVEASVAT